MALYWVQVKRLTGTHTEGDKMANEIEQYATDRKSAQRLMRKFSDRLLSVEVPCSAGPLWTAVLCDGWQLGGNGDRLLMAPDALTLGMYIANADPVPVRWTW